MTRARLGFSWLAFAVTTAALLAAFTYWSLASLATGAGPRPFDVTALPTSH